MLIQCIACQSSHNQNNFSEYRYSIFQWVYPEYNLKAKVLPIPSETPQKEGYSKIVFFGFTANIPDEFNHPRPQTQQNTLVFKAGNGKTALLIMLEDEALLLCSEYAKEREKDFCSAFGSAQEYYHKLYTLTAAAIDENTTTGDMMLIHSKGILFEHIPAIKIYEGPHLTAYANFHAEKDSPIKEELIIFHDALPKSNYLRIGLNFSGKQAEEFLASLKSADRG